MSCVCIYWKTTMKSLSIAVVFVWVNTIAVVVVLALFVTSGMQQEQKKQAMAAKICTVVVPVHGNAECLKEDGKPGIVQYIRDICYIAGLAFLVLPAITIVVGCVCNYWKTTMKTLSIATLSIAVAVVLALFVTSGMQQEKKKHAMAAKICAVVVPVALPCTDVACNAECLKEHRKQGIVQNIRGICSEGKCACFYNCASIHLVSESVKTKQAQSFLLSEKQELAKKFQQVNTTLESLKLRIADSEEQMKICIDETLKSTQEDRHLAVNLEIAKWELADAEKELKWLKSAVSSSEKECEQIQRKMDEIQMELDSERSERKKLDEEPMELNMKVAKMSSENGEAAKQKLQDEIKDCKAILKCGVCFDRPKEVVIVKCYHLFCNPCIQRNLEIRHRKCPGCGTAFGQSDQREGQISV
ncbi:unnamed protein product [Camellia sinensis]